MLHYSKLNSMPFIRCLRVSMCLFICLLSTAHMAQAQSPMSGTYMIGASDTSDYKSPAEAASALLTNGIDSATTFLIEDGLYSGSVEIAKLIKGSSPTNTIVFKGASENASKVILEGWDNDVVYLEDCHHIAFEDLSIKNVSTRRGNNTHTVYLKQCSHIELKNVSVFNNGDINGANSRDYGIHVRESDSNRFENCRITIGTFAMWNYGVYFYYSYNNVISKCLIEGGSHGVNMIGAVARPGSKNTIDSCHITRFGGVGVYSTNFRGLYLMHSVIDSVAGAGAHGYQENHSQGTHLIGNRIKVNGIGLFLEYSNQSGNNTTDTSRVINNTVSSLQATVRIFRGDLLNIYHNSFEGNGGQDAMTVVNSKITTRLRVANNNFAYYRYSAGLEVSFGGYSPLYWDFNNYYFPNSGSFISFNNRSYKTISEFRKATSGHNNSVSIDPEWHGADLRTVADSLNNAGINLSGRSPYVDTDIEGNKRPNGFDGKVDIGPNDFYLYCLPTPDTMSRDIAIGRVQVSNLDHRSSLDTSGFKYFRHKTVELIRGTRPAITIDRIDGNSAIHRKCWVDWNGDGQFDDKTEVVVDSITSDSSLTDSFTVPVTAVKTTTRMRISLTRAGSKHEPCGKYQVGEIEEYNVIVLPDTFPPTLNILGKAVDTIDVYTSWIEPGYKAHDRVEGDLTFAVITQSTIDTARLGVYTVTYSITDSNGYTAKTIRTVVVADLSAPSIHLIGGDTVLLQVYTPYTEAGAIAFDNYDASLTITTIGKPDISKLDTYSIQYCTTDSSGNGPICIDRTVVVFDSIAPTITLNGNAIDTVLRWSNYTDPGITANDNYYQSSEISTYTFGSFVNTQSVGEFNIEYEATDPSGNVSRRLSRKVVVVQPSSISVSNHQGFLVYPNPTYGKLQVRWFDPLQGETSIRIFNSNGVLVYTAVYHPTLNNRMELDLSQVSFGIHYVEVTNHDKVSIERIVIIK